MFCCEIRGGWFWGSELGSSFKVVFTLKIVRVALKIACFFVLDQILVTSHTEMPTQHPLSMPPQPICAKQGRAFWLVQLGHRGFSNSICFAILTALEKTRDDENILDNFITFFVAGWSLF